MLGKSVPHKSRDFFYFENHRRQDADLHDPILDDGDHDAAREVSKAVMKRLGFPDEHIETLFRPKLRDYDPNQAREPAGSPEGGQFAGGAGGGSVSIAPLPPPPPLPPGKHSAREFVSANVGNLTFEHARAALSSHRQSVFIKAAADVDSKTRCSNAKESHILGAWADGAEHSTMLESDKVTATDLRLNAAIKGLLGRQKQVLTFDDDKNGPHQLYRFKMSGEIDQIHKRLLDAGLEFHTLIPTTTGADVVVVDMEGAARTKITAVTNETEVVNGTANFIGTTKEDGTDAEQRDDAARVFESIVAGSGDKAGNVWKSLRDRWSPQLELAEGEGITPASSPWEEKISAAEFSKLAEKTQAEVLEKHAASLGRKASPYKARIIAEIGEAAVRARDFAEWTNWYDRHRPISKALFGEDEPMFQKMLAATSLQKTPGQNAALALAAYEHWKSGGKFETWHPKSTGGGGGVLPIVRDQLVALSKGEPLHGAKIEAFADALNGDWSKVVIDRVMLSTLFKAPNKTATDGQVAIGQAVITAFANRVGWKPAEMQAALWCMHKAGQDSMVSGTVTSFRPYIAAQIEKVHAFFKAHPDLKPKGAKDSMFVDDPHLSMADLEEGWLNALMLVELFEQLVDRSGGTQLVDRSGGALRYYDPDNPYG